MSFPFFLAHPKYLLRETGPSSSRFAFPSADTRLRPPELCSLTAVVLIPALPFISDVMVDLLFSLGYRVTHQADSGSAAGITFGDNEHTLDI